MLLHHTARARDETIGICEYTGDNHTDLRTILGFQKQLWVFWVYLGAAEHSTVEAFLALRYVWHESEVIGSPCVGTEYEIKYNASDNDVCICASEKDGWSLHFLRLPIFRDMASNVHIIRRALRNGEANKSNQK